MSQKWLFFDIDGTIAESDRSVSPYNRQALLKAKAAGHKLLLNTGRSLGYIPNDIMSAGFDGVIAGMGTLIRLDGEIIYRQSLEGSVLRKLTERFLLKQEARVVLEGDLCNYTILPRGARMPKNLRVGHPTISDMRDVEWIFRHEQFAKFTVFEYKKDIPADLFRELNRHFAVIDQGYYQEILPQNAGKGVAIEWMCRELGIDIKDTIAFGDSWNDLDMLDKAGHAVVTSGAPAGVREHADEVTGSCLDGVGRWIERHLL